MNDNVVMVFTSKPLETMINEGGSGYWSANKKRLEKCSYVIATKSNTLREHFPSNTDIKQGAAFLVGKISNIAGSPTGSRLVIQFSEYAEINIPDAWTGNRNPVAYTDVTSFQNEHKVEFSGLEWKEFPEVDIKLESEVLPLTISEAKEGLAKTLDIDPSCIEIKINA
ncbi:hypothetical protein [Litoribacillus peritrichatus]